MIAALTISLLAFIAALLVAIWIIWSLAMSRLTQDELMAAHEQRIAKLTQAVLRQAEAYDAQLSYIAELEETIAKLEGITRQQAYWYVCLTQPVMSAPEVLERVRKYSVN